MNQQGDAIHRTGRGGPNRAIFPGTENDKITIYFGGNGYHQKIAVGLGTRAVLWMGAVSCSEVSRPIIRRPGARARSSRWGPARRARVARAHS